MFYVGTNIFVPELSKDAMTQYGVVYTADFKDIAQLRQEAATKGSSDSFDLRFSYQPYNTRRNTENINSEHECIILDDMASVADFYEKFLTKGGQVLSL